MDELNNIFRNQSNIAGSLDDLDLAMMGLLNPLEEEEEAGDTGDIPACHDMDSIEFHLWMEAEVDKEAARRLATKKQK